MARVVLDAKPCIADDEHAAVLHRGEVWVAPLVVFAAEEALDLFGREPEGRKEPALRVLPVDVGRHVDVGLMGEDGAPRLLLEPDRAAEVVGVRVGHDDVLHVGGA